MFRFNLREPLSTVVWFIRWNLICWPLGLITGSLCSLFLWLLDEVTKIRLSTPGIIWGLPVAGVLIGLTYSRFGKSVDAGNNLVLDEIHEPAGGVPLRMIPLVLLGTIITHLFGGSAGREGTAVQMGGSAASALSRIIPGIQPGDVRILLMAGVAAGFGGIFGTPVAGTVFAMEVLAIGRIHYSAVLPCLMASVISDQCCVFWGTAHTHYQIESLIASETAANSGFHLAPVTLHLVAATTVAGVAFGLTGRLFSQLAHACQAGFRRAFVRPWMRPLVGGMAVILLATGFEMREYLGLGVNSPNPDDVTIVSSFHPGGADAFSWLWKSVFTVLTVGSGFKGGEVTPLFFIGAALGNTLASVFQTPVDFLAAMGFVAVFAGATNTPLACTLMAVELFGGECTLYFAIACFVSFVFSGHTGIYLSQQIGTAKTPQSSTFEGVRLGSLREQKPHVREDH